MKHPTFVVALLLALFLSANFIGLFVLDRYVDKAATSETGVISYRELPSGIQRPDVPPSQSYIFIGIAILIGTAMLLLIIKFQKFRLWKLWYFLSVFVTLAVAFAAFLPAVMAWLLSLAAALWKVFRPNFIIHNLTELFIYGGLAVIFVPVMNLFSASVLLLLISAYDVYAVWKSGHMVKMAKFQAASRLFAGLAVPKSLSQLPKTTSSVSHAVKAVKDDGNVAILGGGDIGFPLLFAGVVMSQFGFSKALTIPVFASLGLAFLFAISRKGRFYPAMPFVSAGCLIGYGFLRFLI